MVNWIKFFIVFLFTLALLLTSFVFYKAYQPAAQWKDQAEKAAVAAGLLKQADRAELYSGTESYTVVYGKDAAGKDKAVFIGRGKKDRDQMKELTLANGVSAKQALANVKREMPVSKLLHVKLGMEENEPIWEVAFKNEAGKLNYVYVLVKDGAWQKRIMNL
ncbi:hypothetical protein NCCP2716_04720 [Sporosarcina sp. NCCP-2716]|uniref:cell wall elongation regulator TseB-like domain-containing protein n=1 Tax=Sporosarcina sp. NCCP-2716 TaxID=2943679 RepID=UPI00203AE842|nr:DUF5590 domain-containing protein [Sporosarcina sp. NCCP-2716]GKV67974.1 hypothetical protein NCCP2716_04720 [Sporosarcina sp. NCCP-2716]